MLLEFEKPIADLELKLQEMKDLAKGRNIDLTTDIQSLEEKIQTLKKETFQHLTRWQRVQLSRHADRPYALDYIYEITNDFIEIHGDRTVKDDKAMIGGLGNIDGRTVMFVGNKRAATPNKDRSAILEWPIPKDTEKL
jgi:acetyl-CoA carboxylase carboxyl transferase subunit alpha